MLGAVATVFAIVAGVRSCTNDSSTASSTSASGLSAGAQRAYSAAGVNSGWGPDRPTFTTRTPSRTAAFNSITDNPAFGDERAFTQCKLSRQPDGAYGDTVGVSSGDEVSVYVYVSNAASPSVPEETISDAHMSLVLDSDFRDDPGLEVILTGTQTTTGRQLKVWDGCRITSQEPIRLAFVRGSATVSTAGAADDQPMSDGVVNNSQPLPSTHGLEPGVVPVENAYGYMNFRVIALAQ